MRNILFLIAFISSSTFADENICPKVISKGEGNWPIQESAFTKETAKKSLKKLSKFISAGTYGMDSVAIDNELLILRGYLLKSRVKTGMLGSKEEFCRFIKDEAYVQH